MWIRPAPAAAWTRIGSRHLHDGVYVADFSGRGDYVVVAAVDTDGRLLGAALALVAAAVAVRLVASVARRRLLVTLRVSSPLRVAANLRLRSGAIFSVARATASPVTSRKFIVGGQGPARSTLFWTRARRPGVPNAAGVAHLESLEDFFGLGVTKATLLRYPNGSLTSSGRRPLRRLPGIVGPPHLGGRSGDGGRMRTARNARGLVARGADGRLRPAALALGLSLALAGCGSTALQQTSAVPGAGQYAVGENGELLAVDPVTGQVVDPTMTGDGLTSTDGLNGVAAPTTSSGSTTVPGTGATSAPGTGAPGAPAPGAPGGPGTPGPGGQPSSPPGTGPIKIGVMTADVGAIFAAFGATADAPPPFDEAFVNYYNARGGISGRKLELVRHTAKSEDNASTSNQRACATFTQDNKVDIVVNTLGGSDIIAMCLKAAGIAMIDTAGVAADKTLSSQFPNWVIPSAMRSDRIAAAQIQQALSAGILKRGDHLGVLIEDCPANQRVRDNVVKPAAAKAGLRLTEGSFRCVQNLVSDLAGVSQDVQRETLRFSHEDVSHVIIVSATEAFALSNFTKNASDQDYFPKYLTTSQAYPWNNSRSDSVVKISDDALPNIYGMGISAPLDTGSMAPVNAAQAAAQKECREIEPTRMGVDGQDASDQPFRLNLFHSVCEGFRTLRTVLEGNGGRTAYPDVAAGFRAMLAKGAPSASLSTGTYSAAAADRTDGATGMRPYKYTGSKWVYTGGPVKVP